VTNFVPMGAGMACSMPGCKTADTEEETSVDSEKKVTLTAEDREKAKAQRALWLRSPSRSLLNDATQDLSRNEGAMPGEGEAPAAPPALEVPDEFVGKWCLIEKDHTENLDEFLKANDISWAIRKVAIKFIGNTFTISMDKIDGGLTFICVDPPSDPKDYVWTYKFGEETKNVENKKKEFTCTIDVKDGIVLMTECPANSKYQKNIKMYITPEGILIRETETGGVVMTRRMMKVEEV